jgi:transcriptional regulator
MIAAVVGIEIRIERIVGRWKLSQNTDERDRATAAGELAKKGDKVTSPAMLEKLAPDL